MKKILLIILLIIGAFQYQLLNNFFYEIDAVLMIQGENIFQNSLMLDVENEEIILYINQKHLEMSIQKAYDLNLPKVIRRYKISFVYFNMLDKSICLRERQCNGVEIKVKIPYMEIFAYEKRYAYGVRRKDE